MPTYSDIVGTKKTMSLRGLIWLYLMGLGYMALALEPGYLDFDNLPDTNFTCVGKVIGGYYADLETNCQMFHVCTIGQLDEPMDIRFLCLNGTVFDQETRVCERIDEVDCSKSEQFYSLNLELYGNTQPPILEESPETEPAIVIKSSSTTTTTTTTTTERPKPKTTRTRYFTTSPPVTTSSVTKVISTHHFPISNRAPDIRFNPEEINISLNPGAPPHIRQNLKPVSFQQQIFANDDNVNAHNNKKAIVTTHSDYLDKDSVHQVQKPKVPATTPKPPKSVVNYGLTHDAQHVTPSDINYGFTYHHQDELLEDDYRTENPHHNNYQYHHQFRPGLSQQFRDSHFKSTTYRSELSLLPTTRKSVYGQNKGATTYRSPFFSSSLKPSQSYQFKTEKPHKLQLPLPILPNLSFSSPAPFALTRHIETKRYTHDHVPPPRIIISASASVSDASGRRLNYSLGTIGVAPLLEQPPKSYDDYKDHDVVLDPFYHDVPKIGRKNDRKRRKRSAKLKHSDVIRNEQEAVDVLKFLFDWYKSQERASTLKIPVEPEDITEINDELSTAPIPPTSSSVDKLDDLDFRTSSLFKRGSRFNIVGDVLSVTAKENEQNESVVTTTANSVNVSEYEYDYVDDNYEPLTYAEQNNETNNTLGLDDGYNYTSYEKVVKNLTNEQATESLAEELEKNSTTPEKFFDDDYDDHAHDSYKEVDSPPVNISSESSINNSEVTSSTTSTPEIGEEMVDTTTLQSITPILDETTYLVVEDEKSEKKFENPEIITQIEEIPEKHLEESIIDSTENPSVNRTTAETTLYVDTSVEITTKNYPEITTDAPEVILILVKEPKSTTTRRPSSRRRGRFRFEDHHIATSTSTTTTSTTTTKTTTTTTTERNEATSSENPVTEETLTSIADADVNENLTDSAISTNAPEIEDTTQTHTEENTSSLLDEHLDSTVLPTTESESEELITLTATENSREETTVTESSPETAHLDQNSEIYPGSTTTENPGIVTSPPSLDIETLTPVEVVTEEITTTTTTTKAPRRGYNNRRTRPPSYRKARPTTSRHRFSTPNFTPRPHRRKSTVEDEIIDTISRHSTTTESLTTQTTAEPKVITTTDHVIVDDVAKTDAPLYKSANPTLSEIAKESADMHETTPLSLTYKVQVRRAKVGKAWVFNCFGREINRFYSDPRDCRLFHYCTSGYSKNQLLDMKFVCDFGTYFDDEKLVCSKTKPARCL